MASVSDVSQADLSARSRASLKHPLISAVVCTYDRYDLLEGAIETLIGQSMPAHQFEILIVDNSPDAGASEQVGASFRAVGEPSMAL